MANKKPNIKSRPAPNVTIRKQPVVAKPAESQKKNLIFISIAVVVTAIVYAISLDNGWAKNWDDGGYVIEHDLVHKLSLHNLAQIFTVFYKGNYHPLTTILYALQYSLVGEKPFLYHFVNLVFHLADVVLVFIFVKRLIKNPEIAFITAIFFGIHPMHVESVAWVSELKDVMYTFFFLLSVLFYMKFSSSKEKSTKLYVVSLLFFLLSCLSKSAAVILPAVLILIDFYNGKKWKSKLANHSNYFIDFIGKTGSSIAGKIPFFIVGISFGIAAVMSQKSAGAIQDITRLYSWLERPLLASYAAMTYLAKMIVPIDLVNMYSYPDRQNGHLPLLYYVAPVVMLILAYLVYYSRKFSKDIVFGTFFFLITIALVLQLLPVGGAIVAERYSYIPYIGMFIIIGKGYVFSQESKLKFAAILKWAYPAILIIGLCVFSVLTFQRIRIWKDGEVLFTDLIKKTNLPFAYNNRGYYYFRFLKNNEKALADFNKCLELDPTFHSALSNRGVLYYNFYGPNNSDSTHLRLALKDFSSALKSKSNDSEALIGRANTYSSMQKFKESIPDYDYYIKIKPDDADAYLWRGIALYNTGKYDQSFTDVEQSMKLKPENDATFMWRGILYYQKKDYQAALNDLNHSIKLNPKKLECYSWRGLTETGLKMYTEAIADYDYALSKNPKDPTVYINRSTAYFEMKNYKQAYADYCSAGHLNYALDKPHFMMLKGLAGDTSPVN